MNSNNISDVPEVLATLTQIQLGDQVFEVKPFSEREDGYNDCSEFIIRVTPLITKVISELTLMGGSTELLSSAVNVESMNDKEVGKLVSDTMFTLSDLNLSEILRDIFSEVPKLCVLIFKYSNPTIDEESVKRLAGTPLNPDLLRAILYQVKADKLFSQIVQWRNVISEFVTT